MDKTEEFTVLRGVPISARGLWLDICQLTELYSEDGIVPVDRDVLVRVSGVDRSGLDSLLEQLRACGLLRITASGELCSAVLLQKVRLRKAREKWVKARRQQRAEILSGFKAPGSVT